MGRITVIVAPHPDDETLYTCAQAAAATDRGDRMVLVGVSDGGASGSRPSGWTVNDLMANRRAEQTAAWRVLTNGTGEIIRWGLPDGAISETAVRVRALALLRTLQADGSDVEFYGACNNGSTQSKDHFAVANGLKRSLPTGVVLRHTREARYAYQGGTIVTPTTAQKARCVQADSAYSAFGHISVPTVFAALRTNGYKNYVIMPA